MSEPQSTRTHDPNTASFAPTEEANEIGRLGGYVLRRTLGSGGMGRVYAAEDVALGRSVALKIMRPEYANRPDAKARFLREARAAAAVTHDHIVRIYQVGEDCGTPYIAMELLAGRPLDAVLTSKPLRVSEVIRIGAEAATGLAAAHAVGLTHRDIKPSNLWLEDPVGRVKILDFGLARFVQDPTLTKPGQIFGTPSYMAPEQAAGRPVDARADLFSLGCVLYHLSTGQRPFGGSDVLAVLHNLANSHPTPPRQLNPEVPASLSGLIVRLMAKSPDDRPRSSVEAANELRRIASGVDSETVDQPVLPEPMRGALEPILNVGGPALSDGQKADLLARLQDIRTAQYHLSPTSYSLSHFKVTALFGSSGMLLGLPVGIGTWLLFVTVNPAARIQDKVAGMVICGFMLLGGIGGVVAALVWHLRRWSRRLTAAVNRLLEDFPEEGRAWGGEVALRDRDVVKSLFTQVVQSNFMAGPTPDPAR